MSSLCRACCGMSPTLAAQLEHKLRQVSSVFPNTTFLVVLTGAGEVIAQSDNPDYRMSLEMLAPIASLKKTATQFAAAMQQSRCPVLHIRGTHYLFSCYEIDANILAFYSDIPAHEMDVFSTAEADAQMQLVLQDVRLLLRNVVV